MEACTVETGLLRKVACGHTAVAKCANCEQPLCTKHAIPQLSATGKKSGAFMCGECHAAQRAIEKTEAKAATPRPAAPAAKPAAAAPAPKPAAEQPKPAEERSDGSIDFTPGKK